MSVGTTALGLVVLPTQPIVILRPQRQDWRYKVAKKVAKKVAAKRIKRKEYTAADVKLLKEHSKSRTPVAKLSKLMKMSEGSLRQKARSLGLGLGHQR